jgi:hypothetical protein
LSILSRLSPRKDRPGGCPACGGPDGTVRFDWVSATRDPGSEFAPYTTSLKEQRPLKSGHLFKCGACGQKWWLSPERETMVLVPRERLLLLEQWSSQALVLSPGLLAKAKSIGATPAHRLAVRKDHAEVPCRIKTLGGEDLDHCLIVFGTHPPLGPSLTVPRWATEIADILPSSFALPHKVRLATTRSEPDPKGHAPTWVLGPQGKPLLLDWVVNFVGHKTAKGSELRLAPRNAIRPQGRVPRVLEPEDLTVFLADPTPDFLEVPAPVLKSRP